MKGVLLVNLGSPESPKTKDVRSYLDQFLMDERVIDLPKWLRTFLVKGIILNTRPKKSAEAYKKIWWKEGSPLIVLSQKLKDKVQTNVSVPIVLAMRYGNPSIKSGLELLNKKGVSEVLIVPLYPQFAMATTETILVLAEKIRINFFPKMKFTSLPSFYGHPDYIRVLGNSIQESLQGKNWEHLLFSYHGVPERHIRKSDITKSHCKIDGKCCFTKSPAHQYCYRHQCEITSIKVAEYLDLKKGTYSTSFQSRVSIIGSWLKPYTDKTVSSFAKKGTKELAIATPAFISDCLETLEEIGMEAAEDFEEKGGKKLHVIPCINDRDDWVKVLSRWIDEWALTAVEI
ncbi:MAG: ferrochelatase [Candidatus Marivariicella framensis]|jgi:ferrochelatase|tara:strand:- start:11432 stop:12463 length:1032 start_codon:yes stop_codon:yes gene_type:complete